MTEEQGRLLKLAADSLMLALGVILLPRPDYMENFTGVALAFGLAALLSGIVYQARRLFKKQF
ncbi:MAG TPA: hypothetical protein VLH18_07885 [Candidatus Limnocylindrales bacterium]|nr:hypothetical protein [Candidatus Limnocylindrales bacterium]